MRSGEAAITSGSSGESRYGEPAAQPANPTPRQDNGASDHAGSSLQNLPPSALPVESSRRVRVALRRAPPI